MADEMRYHAVMTAELRPDVYAGDGCDEVRARWEGYCDGDKEGGEIDGDIKLDPTMFPPGTKVTVEAPCCPECGAPAEVKWSMQDNGGLIVADHVADCECGFDWHAWTLDEFS